MVDGEPAEVELRLGNLHVGSRDGAESCSNPQAQKTLKWLPEQQATSSTLSLSKTHRLHYRYKYDGSIEDSTSHRPPSPIPASSPIGCSSSVYSVSLLASSTGVRGDRFSAVGGFSLTGCNRTPWKGLGALLLWVFGRPSSQAEGCTLEVPEHVGGPLAILGLVLHYRQS